MCGVGAPIYFVFRTWLSVYLLLNNISATNERSTCFPSCSFKERAEEFTRNCYEITHCYSCLSFFITNVRCVTEFIAVQPTILKIQSSSFVACRIYFGSGRGRCECYIFGDVQEQAIKANGRKCILFLWWREYFRWLWHKNMLFRQCVGFSKE